MFLTQSRKYDFKRVSDKNGGIDPGNCTSQLGASDCPENKHGTRNATPA